MFCGVLGWRPINSGVGSTRYLVDEPGKPHQTSCWDDLVHVIPEWNPWFAPIEDEE